MATVKVAATLAVVAGTFEHKTAGSGIVATARISGGRITTVKVAAPLLLAAGTCEGRQKDDSKASI